MKRQVSKSSLFLIEILFVILFFSISCSVCVQLFAKSHVCSVESTELSNAVNYSMSVAEQIKSCNGDFKKASETVSGNLDKESINIYCDKDWNTSPKTDAYFNVIIFEKESSNENIKEYHIAVSNNKKTIYEFDFKKALEG